jgi:hypothetical protein
MSFLPKYVPDSVVRDAAVPAPLLHLDPSCTPSYGWDFDKEELYAISGDFVCGDGTGDSVLYKLEAPHGVRLSGVRVTSDLYGYEIWCPTIMVKEPALVGGVVVPKWCEYTHPGPEWLVDGSALRDPEKEAKRQMDILLPFCSGSTDVATFPLLRVLLERHGFFSFSMSNDERLTVAEGLLGMVGVEEFRSIPAKMLTAPAHLSRKLADIDTVGGSPKEKTEKRTEAARSYCVDLAFESHQRVNCDEGSNGLDFVQREILAQRRIIQARVSTATLNKISTAMSGAELLALRTHWVSVMAEKSLEDVAMKTHISM